MGREPQGGRGPHGDHRPPTSRHDSRSHLQFLKPFKSSNTTTFTLDERDGGTHVTWRMVGPKTFMTRFMGVFMSMDKMVGRDFEKGLTQLGEAATESQLNQAGSARTCAASATAWPTGSSSGMRMSGRSKYSTLIRPG